MTDLEPVEQLTKAAYDTHAAWWAAQHGRGDYWIEEFRRFQCLLPSGLVLEIGSGGGRDARELIARGYRYIGTDVSPGLLAVARQALPRERFYEQSVYSLNLPDHQPFDGFWASVVLLHIPRSRIDQALRQIKRVMKPGAIGFIAVKDGEGEELHREVTGGQILERFFTYWNRSDFTATLEYNGLSVTDYHYNVKSSRTRWHCFFIRC